MLLFCTFSSAKPQHCPIVNMDRYRLTHFCQNNRSKVFVNLSHICNLWEKFTGEKSLLIGHTRPSYKCNKNISATRLKGKPYMCNLGNVQTTNLFSLPMSKSYMCVPDKLLHRWSSGSVTWTEPQSVPDQGTHQTTKMLHICKRRSWQIFWNVWTVW